MDKKILLLGDRGKMGTACASEFSGYPLAAKNHDHFDAFDFKQVQSVIENEKPDLVINTVAFLGIDPCEKEPDKAFRLNTLYPGYLAELSRQHGFELVHFSTDAVFPDRDEGYYAESDAARPLNLYGITKYGGDCLIQARTERHYIFRIPVLFGPSRHKNQFVEKMLDQIHRGAKELSIAGDIFCSPSYTIDIAKEIRRVIEGGQRYGLYHITNEGRVSLYKLMSVLIEFLHLPVHVKEGSYLDFPFIGRKNLCTPIRSGLLSPLRNWKDALREYCDTIQGEFTHDSRNC